MKKHQTKKYFGFTLVELIIVITILAILATIAFVSFQNYTSQTRDTKRVSDLTQISKGLDIFQVTSGTLPTPDNPTTYTGGNVTLLKGKINSKVLSNLGGEVFDPSTKTEYTYATIGNGKYYQIGADSENLLTSVFQNTYADAKSSIVKGNYLFDPSLPSLIISSGSSLYNPNNCFVINGGTNLVSNNTNCTPKSSTSLKNFDNSLVGYWDMETTTGTMLKDLSGNGNDGIGSGGVNIGSGQGFMGKSTYFDGSNDFFSITNTGDIISSNNELTIISILSFSGITYQTAGKLNTVIIKGNPDKMTTNSGFWLSVDNRFNNVNLAYTCFGNTNGGFAGGGNSHWEYKTKDIISDNYYILAVTINNKLSNFYINGKLINKVNINNLNLHDIGQGFYIGGLNISYLFNGVIDEVKIYNRTLSDEEILQQAKSAGF